MLFLNGKTDDLPQGAVVLTGYDYVRVSAYYDYLLTTGTFGEDYLLFTDRHQGSSDMVEMLRIYAFVLPLIAIFASLYVLRSDVANGSFKNLVTSPIKRRSILFGKLLFLLILITTLFISSMLFPFIRGLCNRSARLLIYGTDGYRVQSVFATVFFPKAISIFSAMLFTANFTLFCTFFKKRLWQTIVPFSIFAFFHILYFVVGRMLHDTVLFRLFPIPFVRFAEVYQIVDVFNSVPLGRLNLLIAALFMVAFHSLTAFFSAKKLSTLDVRG